MYPSAVHPAFHLAGVHYGIRGKLTRQARALEAAGQAIVKLNIGNPGRYGFHVPEHLAAAISAHLGDSDAYCHEQGLESAREAILAMQRSRGAGVADIQQIFIGNGVSELIDLSLRALLNPGDQVLLPAPDYPLWSAATVLNGGLPRYYTCPAARGHLPDPDEIEALCGPRTRAIVLINPNNPTGACYPRALLERIIEIAERRHLLLLSDEIYDGVRYDDTPFTPLASLTYDVPCVTFAGLSKVHLACGFRVGWATLSGDTERVAGFRDALQLLSALHLCANVPAQWAIAPALTGPDTITALTREGGRLHESRRAVLEGVARSRFLDCVTPRGALYAFPSVRAEALPAFEDETFALRLLNEEHVLVVPGSSFNLSASRHFRITLLPEADVLSDVFARIERVLGRMADEQAQTRAA